MQTAPDPVQDWAGFWLREQQRHWQRWAQSCDPSTPPVDLAAVAVHTWQQGCELWLNNLQTTLPAQLFSPIATVLKQSQDDMCRALVAAQARQRPADAPTRPEPQAQGIPGLWFSVLRPDRDQARLANDPVWREHILASNGFVQFHIQAIVEILNALKSRLPDTPGTDSGPLLEKQLPDLYSGYQAKLHSAEYRQVLERLINALVALAAQS